MGQYFREGEEIKSGDDWYVHVTLVLWSDDGKIIIRQIVLHV